MKSATHFRFLLDYVEDVARRTPSVLFNDSRHFWDDILESCYGRSENRTYWIFCTRWIRESLLEVMGRGTPRALRSIFNAIEPDHLVTGGDRGEMSKSRTIAHLLPILMTETLTKVDASATLRFGPATEGTPSSFHPKDH